MWTEVVVVVVAVTVVHYYYYYYYYYYCLEMMLAEHLPSIQLLSQQFHRLTVYRCPAVVLDRSHSPSPHIRNTELKRCKQTVNHYSMKQRSHSVHGVDKEEHIISRHNLLYK